MLPFEKKINEQPLANILSFEAVASKFRVTINTELYPPINVHLQGRTRIIFKQCGAGIYYLDTTNGVFAEDETIEHILLNKLYSNNSFFHRQETKGAGEARILQQLVGWPYTQILR